MLELQNLKKTYRTGGHRITDAGRESAVMITRFRSIFDRTVASPREAGSVCFERASLAGSTETTIGLLTVIVLLVMRTVTTTVARAAINKTKQSSARRRQTSCKYRLTVLSRLRFIFFTFLQEFYDALVHSFIYFRQLCEIIDPLLFDMIIDPYAAFADEHLVFQEGKMKYMRT